MERRTLNVFVAIAAALCVGSSALAQRSEQPAAPSAQLPQVSDEDLRTFANIYIDLQDSMTKHQAELATAKTDEESRDIQARFQEESIATMSKRGWTLDKYNSVVTAINADPALSERTRALLKR